MRTPTASNAIMNCGNGGYAAGSVTLWKKENGEYVKLGDFDGEMGGCEYGEYDK